MKTKLTIIGTVTLVMAGGLHYDEPGSYREDLSGSGMDMPSAVFLPSGKNSERGSI